MDRHKSIWREREKEELRTAIQALILLENVKSGLKMPHKQTIHLFAEQEQKKNEFIQKLPQFEVKSK